MSDSQFLTKGVLWIDLYVFCFPVFESDKTAVRIFPALFKHTQRQLRKIFAMELVPLRPRGQENEALTQQKRDIQASQGGETMVTQRKDPASPGTFSSPAAPHRFNIKVGFFTDTFDDVVVVQTRPRLGWCVMSYHLNYARR